MIWIASATPTTGNQVTFSSIPQTFTHLQLRAFARGTTSFADGLTQYMRLNNDSTSAYAQHSLFGNGSIVSSSALANNTSIDASQVFADAGATTSVYGVCITDILDYTNTNKNTTIRAFGGWDGNSGRGRVTLASGHWRNTDAVNRIDILIDGGWVAGSRLDLYGVTTSSVTGA